MNNVAIDLVWADSFLRQKFLASGCFLLAGSARIAAWSRWLSSTQHSINMHNMTGFGGRLLECWFVSSSEWNDVWLWSHQAWTSKARESLPPRSWGCHWLVTMCLCPIDCEMVCCYTAVLHLRPTEVIDWFGHVECSHLVCSNVFFLLGFFFSFLPLLSHFPFIRKPRVLAGESEQAAAKGHAQLCLVNKVGLLQVLLSVLLRDQVVWGSFPKKHKLEEGRDATTEPRHLGITADFLLILQKRSAIVIRLPK